MNWFDTVRCRCAERCLGVDAGGGPIRRALRRMGDRHAADGCASCRGFARRLRAVERGLRALGRAPQVTSESEVEALRMRVFGEYHRELGSRPPPTGGRRERRPRLERLVLMTGAAAALTLVGSLLVSRRSEFGPPPRTVYVQLPAGYAIDGQPSVVILRASGVEEQR